MSDIEKIGVELHAMSAGIDRATHAAVRAAARVQEVAVRAAGSGFAGVAAAMGGVGAAVADIRQRLAAADRSVGEAIGPVSAAGSSPSPEETIALLLPVGERITTVQADVSGIVAVVTETQHLASMSLHGGRPAPVVAALEEIRQALNEVFQQAGTVRADVSGTVAKARRLGDLTGPVSRET